MLLGSTGTRKSGQPRLRLFQVVLRVVVKASTTSRFVAVGRARPHSPPHTKQLKQGKPVEQPGDMRIPKYAGEAP